MYEPQNELFYYLYYFVLFAYLGTVNRVTLFC